MLRGAQARVARALLERGPSTVSGLAEHLELTPAAVRRHLEELLESGLVESSQRPPFGPDPGRRGRGRPARYYTMTQAGRDRFEQAYDDVAVGALRFMAEAGGEDLVMAFARRRVAEWERRYADLLDADSLAVPDIAAGEGIAGRQSAAASLQAAAGNHAGGTTERVEALVDALAADGYAAMVVPTAGGVQVCQHNCPVAHVAAEFPQLCEAETESFGRLLGTHVMRLATLAHGDGICTTLVPTSRLAAVPPAAPASPADPEPPAITPARADAPDPPTSRARPTQDSPLPHVTPGGTP